MKNKILFKGGSIYTANKEQPRAEAVIVEGDTIVYVGDEPPQVCPVCKAPNRKFEKIGG